MSFQVCTIGWNRPRPQDVCSVVRGQILPIRPQRRRRSGGRRIFSTGVWLSRIERIKRQVFAAPYLAPLWRPRPRRRRAGRWAGGATGAASSPKLNQHKPVSSAASGSANSTVRPKISVDFSSADPLAATILPRLMIDVNRLSIHRAHRGKYLNGGRTSMGPDGAHEVIDPHHLAIQRSAAGWCPRANL